MNPNGARSHLQVINFAVARRHIKFVVKVKTFVPIQWSGGSPQFCWLLSLKWLAYFEQIVWSFWKHSVLDVCSEIHMLPHTHSSISAQMIVVLSELDISTWTVDIGSLEIHVSDHASVDGTKHSYELQGNLWRPGGPSRVIGHYNHFATLSYGPSNHGVRRPSKSRIREGETYGVGEWTPPPIRERNRMC